MLRCEAKASAAAIRIRKDHPIIINNRRVLSAKLKSLFA
jgi:hypothetical protein